MRRKPYMSARLASGTIRVATGVRPGGSSSTMEMSRSPYSISDSVRGMGVADMTSTLGASPFSDSSVRWRTPKRCCSSVTTRPRFLYSTPSVISAWVPIARSHSPPAMASWASRCCFGVRLPTSSPTRMPRGASSFTAAS